MAPRISIDDRLKEAQKLSQESDLALLRKKVGLALQDRANLVAAEAAKVIRESVLTGFETELLAAWVRMLINPLKTDPGCTAKTAIIEALGQLEYDEPDFYLEAIKYEQLEPTWGGRDDTAVNIRGAAGFAIARSRRLGIIAKLEVLVDLLVNSQSHRCRTFAVQAIADTGRDEAIPVLKLKFGSGDPNAEVIGACMAGLLALAPESSIPLVASHLNRYLVTQQDDLFLEAAAALGECGRPEAVKALVAAWKMAGDPGLKESLLTSIGLSRDSGGVDFLISRLRPDRDDSEIALNALTPICVYPDLREKVRHAVIDSGDSLLIRIFERRYGKPSVK